MYQLGEWMVCILVIVIGVMDVKKREIPIWILVLTSVVVSVLAICCTNVSAWHRMAGAMFGGVFFIISRLTKEAVGYGDSWMILLLAVHLGILRALQLLFIASVLASVFAVFYLWKRKWKKNATLPFVPFLAVGYIGVMFG